VTIATVHIVQCEVYKKLLNKYNVYTFLFVFI
jgi:hypothetical protein